VRELENAIEHAFVLCRGEWILPEHLPETLRTAVTARVALGGSTRSPLEAAEVEVIRQTLERCSGNLSRAATELGMHRTTLWRKLRGERARQHRTEPGLAVRSRRRG
jgi:DNA-binding NtrC family response regulator